MADFTLSTAFGPLTLTIGDMESPTHQFEQPRRNFNATLGEFGVNGKSYARLGYSFFIYEGSPRIHSSDWRVYDSADRRQEMTEKGRSKVRDEIEAVVSAFLASKDGPGALVRADMDQRARLEAKCNGEIAALREQIAKIEALRAQAADSSIPAHVTADKLRRI